MSNVARSIIRESLRAKENEAIVIQATPHTLDLANDVGLEAYKVGADPAILVETDELFYGQFRYLTPDQLRTTSKHCLGFEDYADSYVWLGYVTDPIGMRRVPEEKMSANSQGEAGHYRKSVEKKRKNVGVALGFVTRPRAKAYGFNYPAWKKMIEAAITVDYKEMARTADRTAQLLQRPAEVRVKADNGTDLRFRLAGPARKAFIDDGIISDEDIAAGNVYTNLPAGAIRCAPVEDSAEGTFVGDVKIPSLGSLVDTISWTFKHGKVVDFSAKKNVRLAQSAYTEASGAKDMFGQLGIGLNKKVAPGYLTSAYARGTVSVGIGDNKLFDGANESSYGFEAYHSAATVILDGKPIIEGGRLLV
ncbi:MAG: aminopeptidase [Thermoplasmata archaeon]